MESFVFLSVDLALAAFQCCVFSKESYFCVFLQLLVKICKSTNIEQDLCWIGLLLMRRSFPPLCNKWQKVEVLQCFRSDCVLCLVGEMVQGKLLPQPELSLLSAAGFRRCLGEDHSVGCGQRHCPL